MPNKNHLYIICLMVGFIQASLFVPKFSPRMYVLEGDIYIGALVPVSENVPDGYCTNTLSSSSSLEWPEAVVYAIKTLNKRHDILPNITLGLVLVDDCSKDLASLAGATLFAPRPNENTSMCTKDAYDNRFDILGMVGPATSRKAVMAASLLSIFEIPLVSPRASSDELSDKSRFKYFLRMTPPDKYQAYCIVDFLLSMNWTYVSILYSEGSYGENGAKQLIHRLRSTSICVPILKRISSLANEEDFKTIVSMLYGKINARVVIIFVERGDQKMLYQALGELGLDDYFILLGGDSSSPWSYGKQGDGNFGLSLPNLVHEDFNNYFMNLNPFTSDNPWIKDYWHLIHDCSWEDVDNSCHSYPNSTKGMSGWATILYLYIDSTMVLGNAIDYIIKNDCPEAFETKSHLKSCVQGPRLLQVLKNLTFEGSIGTIDFDEDGNLVGKYEVSQYRHTEDQRVIVAEWSQRSGSLEIFQDKIRWDILQQKANSSVLASIGIESLPAIPESICSKPCKQKEYYLQRELKCCWDCQTCRNNEIIIDNFTGCAKCPLLAWPDNETATLCEMIEPTFLQWTSPIVLGLVILTLLGIVANTLVTVLYIKNRHQKLIKASSRELSMLILMGTFFAYLSVFPGLSKPTFFICSLNRYGFNMAVTFMYAPLMVRTSRIYRIFSAGKKGTKKPALIGFKSQMLITGVLILLQVILSIVGGLIAPPFARLRMQVPTEKHVELFCDLPLQGLLTPLVYNICLMLLCAIFGFMTRKLPANFNESWFIFISVSTTSFLWVVILPTYFTQFYANNQAVLLSVCLIINATVTMVLLYVPKIYAIYFVDEDKIELSPTGATDTSIVGPITDATSSHT